MRWVVVVLAVLFVAGSCGDDEDAADPARFCQINTQLEQIEDFTTASSEDARDIIARTRDLLAEAETVAPAEISAAVGVTADSYRLILDFYADADFDVDPADFEAAIGSGDLPVDPPEADEVFGWLDENCGP